MVSKLSRLVKRRSVYIVGLEKSDAIRVQSCPKPYSLERITWSNVNLVRGTRDETVAYHFRQMLVAGQVGLYLIKDNQVAGHFWVEHAQDRVVRAWGGVDFGPDEALLKWGWVNPKYRGQKLFQVLIAELVQTGFAEFKCRRILSDVPLEPTASLIAHSRVGFRLYGKLEYTTLARRLIRRRFQEIEDSTWVQRNEG